MITIDNEYQIWYNGKYFIKSIRVRCFMDIIKNLNKGVGAAATAIIIIGKDRKSVV